MNKIITAATLAGFLGLAGSAFSQTATSNVVGYETVTLQPGQFNLFGARLHGAEVFVGTFDNSSATSLVDTGATFPAFGPVPYVAELANGTTVHFLGTDAVGDTISNLSGITAAEEQDYVIRPANTLNSVLGSPPVLTPSLNGNPAGADVVWLPTGLGFTKYYYVAIAANPALDGWYDVDLGAGGGKKGDTAVIDPGAAVYVETVGSTSGTTDVVVSGDLKTTPTAFEINQQWNLVGSAYPEGGTLDASGISAYVLPSLNGNPAGVDIVWVPSGVSFTKYYYVSIAANPSLDGWYDVDLGAGGGKKGAAELSSGFYIQDTDSAGGGAISPPAYYANL